MRTRKSVLTFYRSVVGLTVERQREACHAAAKRLGLAIASEYTSGEPDGDRDEWIRSLKSTDVAMVATLTVIPEPRRPGTRPTSDLSAALFEITGPGTLLVAALADVTSADGPKWVAAVREAQDAIAQGKRKLSRAKAQTMAAKSREGREPGVITRWLSREYASRRKEHSATWRDTEHANDFAALSAMPDDVKSDIGSVSSARRIFGRRHPRKKTGAGRPRKST